MRLEENANGHEVDPFLDLSETDDHGDLDSQLVSSMSKDVRRYCDWDNLEKNSFYPV